MNITEVDLNLRVLERGRQEKITYLPKILMLDRTLYVATILPFCRIEQLSFSIFLIPIFANMAILIRFQDPVQMASTLWGPLGSLISQVGINFLIRWRSKIPLQAALSSIDYVTLGEILNLSRFQFLYF